jgi:hypothetical protein
VTSHLDATIGGARPDRFLYYNYPIEQLARSARTRFQLGFARMTISLLPDLEDVIFEATPLGLNIFGAHETALHPAEAAIRELHGSDVAFDEPAMRLFHGEVVHEPIMWLRVHTGGTCTEAVIQDLVGRGAEIEEVDWMARPPLIRARAPLRKLLGYARTLADLSHSSADLRMGLSHYAPMPPPPGKAA